MNHIYLFWGTWFFWISIQQLEVSNLGLSKFIGVSVLKGKNLVKGGPRWVHCTLSHRTRFWTNIYVYVYLTWLFPQAHTRPFNTHAPSKSIIGLEHKMWGANSYLMPMNHNPSNSFYHLDLTWAKSLNMLKFFKSTITIFINILLDLSLLLGWPSTCIDELFFNLIIVGLCCICPYYLK